MLVSDFTFDYFFSGARIKFDLTGFNFLILVNKVSMKYYFILGAYKNGEFHEEYKFDRKIEIELC